MNPAVFRILDFETVLRDKGHTFRNLVGYYETITPRIHTDAALDILFTGLYSEHPAPVLYSSLTDFSGAVGQWTQEEVDQALRFAERGWFTFGKEHAEALESFTETPAGPASDVRTLCRLVFRGLTYGYLFLYFEHIGLVAYPHDHEGFGFAAQPNAAGKCIAKDFLDDLLHHDYLEVSFVN